MKHAVAYIRVSGTSQLGGDGPERQSAACRQFARAKRYTIAETFTDDVSGTKDSTERPGFAAMLEYCRQNDVQTIIIEKIDRWMRDMIVGELLLAMCRNQGITVLDASTGFALTDESDDPWVKMVRRQMAVAAEFNKDILVYNMRKARERIRSKGRKCEGRKGYSDTEQGRQAIRRAQSLRREGKSYGAIAKTLQAEGYQTANGGPWKKGTVHGMIG